MNQRPDQDRYYETSAHSVSPRMPNKRDSAIHENEYEGDDCERVNPIKYGLGRRGIDGVEEIVDPSTTKATTSMTAILFRWTAYFNFSNSSR